jgi:hypothetical protein
MIVLLSAIAVFFTGCRPRGILHSWEMREVLVDMHKTDAMLQLAGYRYSDDEARRIYYAQVMEKHDITQAQFDSSLVWYTAHPQLFDKIYPKVIAEITKQEAEYLALHEAELAAWNDGHPAPEPPTTQPFTSIQLDSVLWRIQNGPENSWNINARSYRATPSISPRLLPTDY